MIFCFVAVTLFSPDVPRLQRRVMQQRGHCALSTLSDKVNPQFGFAQFERELCKDIMNTVMWRVLSRWGKKTFGCIVKHVKNMYYIIQLQLLNNNLLCNIDKSSFYRQKNGKNFIIIIILASQMWEYAANVWLISFKAEYYWRSDFLQGQNNQFEDVDKGAGKLSWTINNDCQLWFNYR